MRETKQKIAEYKKHIIGLKEKVIGTLILLVMSTIMLGTVSFAWLTLSRNPEVSGVATNVASNGNLEIALAPADGSVPQESKVGDSLLGIDERNRTWGNLVNLSVPEYGLENIVLRPAVLNDTSLLSAPLKSAIYSADGRVTGYTTDFAYTRWSPLESDSNFWTFQPTEDLGIRAISSVDYGNVTGDTTAHNMKKDAENSNMTAYDLYLRFSNTSENNYMKTLTHLMSVYMTSNLNGTNDPAELYNPPISGDHIAVLKQMYDEFIAVYEAEAEAIAKALSLHTFLTSQGTVTNAYDKDAVLKLKQADFVALETAANKWLAANGKTSVAFDYSYLVQFIADYNTIVKDTVIIKALPDTGINWRESGLNTVVNHLIDINSVTFYGNNSKINNKTVSDLLKTLGSASGLSGGMELLSLKTAMENDIEVATITKGIIKNFEMLNGARLIVDGLTVSATVYVSTANLGAQTATLKNITVNTNADKNQFSELVEYVDGLNFNSFAATDLIAKDTYGYIVDLFVRTNAASSYLVLQGNLLTETVKIPVTKKITKDSGEVVEVNIYVINYKENDEDRSVDVYFEEVSGTKKWYYSSDQGEVPAELLSQGEPVQKIYTKEVPYGYEGEDRIWSDSDSLSITGTNSTQGSGSCFVFYTKSADEEIKSVKILSNLKVVFVDGEGNHIASAALDTENYYAENGKIILPLVLGGLKTQSVYDHKGNYVPVITALEKNMPQRISAIVYIDGSSLTNKEVLAINDIQGHLNIQFGSTVILNPIGNDKLENSVVEVSATVNGSNSVSADYKGKENPISVKVSVKVSDSVTPNSVKLYFVRSISETQGYKEVKVTLNNVSQGVWEYDYIFDSPGSYVLRWVELDGIEYELEGPCSVVINGYAIKNVNWTAGEADFVKITSDLSWSSQVSVEFISSDYLPQKIQGRFLNQETGDVVNVNFTLKENGAYGGTAVFSTSGVYSFDYLVLDEKEYPISSAMRKTADLSLGVYARIYTTSPTQITLLSNKAEMAENELNLAMFAAIYDDKNEKITDFTDVKLYYGLANSSLNARGMESSLSWNGDSGFFEGAFLSESTGNFSFIKIEADGNLIDRAVESPVFAIMPPDPPKYLEYNVQDIQYAPNSNEAVIKVKMQFAEAAFVQPVFAYWDKQPNNFYGMSDNLESITKITGQFVTGIKSVDDDGTAWFTFTVPTNSSTKTQDGWWQLISINLYNVCDADGNMYTDENNTYTMNLLKEEKTSSISTKVISSIKVSFDRKIESNLTGTFMAEQSFGSGISMSISDFEGKSLDSYLSDVSVNFIYEMGTAQTFGGYGSTAIDLSDENARPQISFVLSANTSGKYAVTSDKTERLVAGAYNTVVKFKLSFATDVQTIRLTKYDSANKKVVSESQYTNVPTLVVTSAAPVVTIASVTPSSYAYSTGDNGTGYTTGFTPIFNSDKTEVTAYIVCTSESGCSGTTYTYKAPAVALNISGMGAATGATLKFVKNGGGDVHLYTSEDKHSEQLRRDAYTWSKDGNSTLYVGNIPQGSSGSSKNAAGELLGQDLTLEYNGMTFTFTVNIRIINTY